MFNGNIISIDPPDNHSIFIDLFHNELETMLNTLLPAEFTEFLSYNKYDVSVHNTSNSRNGYYDLSLYTIFGNITIKIPYDQLKQFQNKLLTPYNRNFGNFEKMDPFHNRPLPSQFAVVYLDATFITVKCGAAQKENLHVLIGITPLSENHVINYGIYPSKSTSAYKELLDHANQGGLEDMHLFVGDGFQGLQ